MVARGYCNTVEYSQIPPNTIWELGLKLISGPATTQPNHNTSKGEGLDHPWSCREENIYQSPRDVLQYTFP